ncbi:carbohydrate kinase family protein [Streptomyces cacaoi]|uniref:carbohydrate kinase family protein n=1 Tax=Streptomyces cacaoi TaxID=1898 RepID=UPI003CC824B0
MSRNVPQKATGTPGVTGYGRGHRRRTGRGPAATGRRAARLRQRSDAEGTVSTVSTRRTADRGRSFVAGRPPAARDVPAARRFDPLGPVRPLPQPGCDVYLTGTVFLDIVFTGLDSAPVRGTESWARGMGSSPGGIANMATALARLGLRTSLAAAFGDDMYGDYCREVLEHGEHIDLSLSHTVPGWHSPVTVSMAYEGERTMISHGHEAPPKNAATAYDPDAPECPPPAAACVSSLVPDGPQEWITTAARRGSRIFADVGWDETGRWDLSALAELEQCEAFLPNAAEAMRYTRTDCPRAAAHALAEHVPLAVVTMGADGAYAVDGGTGETAQVPGIAVEALDTTGAGDVFVAGFVTGSLAGWPLADRLAFAGLTAALSVQEFGGSLSAPDWPQIAAWWRRGAGRGLADRGRFAFLDRILTACTPSAPPRRAVPTLGFRSPAGG